MYSKQMVNSIQSVKSLTYNDVVVVGWLLVGYRLKYMATTGLYIHKSLTIIAKNRLVHVWILHRFHQDYPDWITQENTRIFWTH